MVHGKLDADTKFKALQVSTSHPIPDTCYRTATIQCPVDIGIVLSAPFLPLNPTPSLLPCRTLLTGMRVCW